MTAPRRRWFAFSLRTLFVAVALLCCWLGYSLNWIKERREFLQDHKYKNWPPIPDYVPIMPPGCLWLFGEKGRPRLTVKAPGDIAEGRRLFPEAEVDCP
jgi:hypothetical protein